MDNPSETAEAWEIWDKSTKTVYWYGEGVPELLDRTRRPFKAQKLLPVPAPDCARFPTPVHSSRARCTRSTSRKPKH
jgi:hypothetical protein